MPSLVLKCNRGDSFQFRARIKGTGAGGVPSISTDYDEAKFQANLPDGTEALSATTDDASIVIGAPDVVTGDIAVDVYLSRQMLDAVDIDTPTQLSARLRLYQSTDDTKAISWAVPLQINPDPIDDV